MIGEAVGRCMAGLTLLGQGEEGSALDILEEDSGASLLVMGSMILGMLDARGVTIEDLAARAVGKEWN